VADPGFLHPHGHVAAVGERIEDPAIPIRLAQRLVDRPLSQALDEEEDRMSARSVGPGDDGANPRPAADDVMVQYIEGLAPIPRARLERHRQARPLTGALEGDLELLPDCHCRDNWVRVDHGADRLAVHGQQNISWSDATLG